MFGISLWVRVLSKRPQSLIQFLNSLLRFHLFDTLLWKNDI